MADGAQANPKGFRKKVLVRCCSGWPGPSCRASSPSRTFRSSLGVKFLAITVLAGSVLSTAQGSLLNLKSMVEATTGRSAILSFVGYGCYCGLGGRGLPMDEVDWCCHAHDCCYQKLFDQGCRPYVDHYVFTMENDTVVVCSELNETDCDKQTCECDKSVALCLRNQTYRERYRGYLNIYCQGPTPNCSIYRPPPEFSCGQDFPLHLRVSSLHPPSCYVNPKDPQRPPCLDTEDNPQKVQPAPAVPTVTKEGKPSRVEETRRDIQEETAGEAEPHQAAASRIEPCD